VVEIDDGILAMMFPPARGSAPTVVVGGFTLGMPIEKVTPPAAAAMVAVVMSSLWVNPRIGGDAYALSIKPGITLHPPLASITVFAVSGSTGWGP